MSINVHYIAAQLVRDGIDRGKRDAREGRKFQVGRDDKTLIDIHGTISAELTGGGV